MWTNENTSVGVVGIDWDQELKTRIEAALERGGYCGLSEIEVHTDDGMVLLRGKSNTYYLKQMAQSIVLKVPGVGALENRIEVI